MASFKNIPSALYNQGWNWAAKNFGTECNGSALTADGARALDCWIAGWKSGRRSKMKRKQARRGADRK